MICAVSLKGTACNVTSRKENWTIFPDVKTVAILVFPCKCHRGLSCLLTIHSGPGISLGLSVYFKILAQTSYVLKQSRELNNPSMLLKYKNQFIQIRTKFRPILPICLGVIFRFSLELSRGILILHLPFSMYAQNN